MFISVNAGGGDDDTVYALIAAVKSRSNQLHFVSEETATWQWLTVLTRSIQLVGSWYVML